MSEFPFNDFLSFSDAAAIWGLDDSTLRHSVSSGRLKAGEDCQKYGKQWVIRISSMCRVYGVQKYDRWVRAGRKLPTRTKPQQLEGQVTMLDDFTVQG